MSFRARSHFSNASASAIFFTLLIGFTTPMLAEQHFRDVESVDLFVAEKAKLLHVRLIPRDATQATLVLSNQEKRPLAIRMPRAFAGLPVLAQPGVFPGGNQNQQQAPQAIGLGFPRGGNNNQGNNPFQQFRNGPFNRLQNNRLLNNGIFNVPAEKTVKLRLPAVCLEYGKPDPRPRIVYELRPLDRFTSDKKVYRLLDLFSQGSYSQQVAQLAMWHLTADLTWKELDGMKIRHVNGRQEKRFRTAEVELAKKMIGEIQPESVDTHGDSLAAR